LALGLSALVAGCQQPRPNGACACPIFISAVVVSTDTGLSRLDRTGDGCASSGDPICSSSEGGTCLEYLVPLSSPGTCVLVATAKDGRQALATVDVRAKGPAGCCGVPLAADHDVMFHFPALEWDGAAPDGGDDGSKGDL
jgi:hypothetical protein